MDYIYIGWGQKQDFMSCSTNLVDSMKLTYSSSVDLTEYEELTKKQIEDLKKQHKKKKHSFIPKNNEKVIKNYTYN